MRPPAAHGSHLRPTGWRRLAMGCVLAGCGATAARAQADTVADRTAFTENAKAQVTIWGGEGNLSDYASKAWQGMVASYYWRRWQMAFAALRAAAQRGHGVDARELRAQIGAWEQGWVTDGRTYSREAPGDPVAASRALIALADRA